MTELTLYYWPTPNGQKITIMLEELDVPYELKHVDISKGDQLQSKFLAISPNNKIPALTDKLGPGQKPIAIFESGAILIYLAEKFGKFYPVEPVQRYTTLQWLMFQMASVGPMLGQNHHFRQYAPEKIPYAIKRYTDEAIRIYGVVEKQLMQVPYISGKELTIADFAIFPWFQYYAEQGIDITQFPYIKKWYDELSKRPKFIKALALE